MCNFSVNGIKTPSFSFGKTILEPLKNIDKGVSDACGLVM